MVRDTVCFARCTGTFQQADRPCTAWRRWGELEREEQTGQLEGSSPQSEQCLAMFSGCLVMLLALEMIYKEYLPTWEGDGLPASGSLKSSIQPDPPIPSQS